MKFDHGYFITYIDTLVKEMQEFGKGEEFTDGYICGLETLKNTILKKVEAEVERKNNPSEEEMLAWSE